MLHPNQIFASEQVSVALAQTPVCNMHARVCPFVHSLQFGFLLQFVSAQSIKPSQSLSLLSLHVFSVCSYAELFVWYVVVSQFDQFPSMQVCLEFAHTPACSGQARVCPLVHSICMQF